MKYIVVFVLLLGFHTVLDLILILVVEGVQFVLNFGTVLDLILDFNLFYE